MLKNAKIGDKVYSINNGYIDLEVIDINDRKITCKGKYLIENYESIQFKEVQRVFLDIELFKENIVTDEVLTKIPKWKKITNITYNMTLPLNYLYDYYLNGVRPKSFLSKRFSMELRTKNRIYKSYF